MTDELDEINRTYFHLSKPSSLFFVSLFGLFSPLSFDLSVNTLATIMDFFALIR